jgi:diguanylate cyclase (GGDEF)-like protein
VSRLGLATDPPDQRSTLSEAMFSVYLRGLSVPIVQAVGGLLIILIGGIGELAQLVYPESVIGKAITWRLYICLILGCVVLTISVFDRAKLWLNAIFGIAFIPASLLSGYYLSYLREPHSGAMYVMYLIPLLTIAMPARLGIRTLVTSSTLLVVPGIYMGVGWQPELLIFVFLIVLCIVILSVFLGHGIFYRLNRQNFFTSRELEKNRQKIEYLAEHDQLTGLYNRGEFETRLAEEVKRSGRYDHNLSLLMIDLDHFKKINDTHGHTAGDDVLEAMGTLLNRNADETVRFSDIPGRYGGEEFTLLLPETRAEGAKTVAERIRQQLKDETFRSPEGETFQVSCSIGIATLNGDIERAEDLVNRADEALYDAKDSGRDQVVVYQE